MDLRYLAAAHARASTEHAAAGRIGATLTAAHTAEPTTRQIRAWARAAGLTVADRGRLPLAIRQAWHDANPG